MKKEKKKINWQKAISIFVFASLALASVAVIVIMIMAPATLDQAEPHQKIKSDYVLMLSQCILGMLAMFLPSILKKHMKLEIPSGMLAVYAIFLYCSIFLGEVKNFYYVVPHWDTILHTFSGAMLGAIGFSVVNFLNEDENVKINMSPVFVAFFAFGFAISLGVIWEIYEYLADGLLNTNMQKFALEDGTLLAGHAALSDTMKDLMVDALGAGVMCVIGALSRKNKNGLIEKLEITKAQ